MAISGSPLEIEMSFVTFTSYILTFFASWACAANEIEGMTASAKPSRFHLNLSGWVLCARKRPATMPIRMLDDASVQLVRRSIINLSLVLGTPAPFTARFIVVADLV